MARRASEQQLNRSYPRIAKGINMAFHRMASLASCLQRAKCTSPPLNEQTCYCEGQFMTLLGPREVLPSPEDFLKMAQAME